MVGTTGWYDRLPEIRSLVKESGLLYSPNFSIGVNMMFRLVSAAAEMMNNAAGYDLYVHEWHHRQKADSPSGTALKLAEILLSKIDRKKKTRDRKGRWQDRSRGALHVSSTRVGNRSGNPHRGIRLGCGCAGDQACRENAPRVRAGRRPGGSVVERKKGRLYDGRRGVVGAPWSAAMGNSLFTQLLLGAGP